MKQIKRWLALLLLAAMPFALAACGGSGDNPSPSAASPSPAPGESAPAQPSGDGKDPEDHAGTLTVYSPHDAGLLDAGVKIFEDKYPNVEVKTVTGSTGSLLERVKAESGAPVADVFWGGAADALNDYKECFQPYEPSCINLLAPGLYDPEHLWTGDSPLPMVFLVNTYLVAEAEIPQTWKDLADPKWRGMIALADPASSGCAFTQLCTILMNYGTPEDDYAAGWALVRRMIPNLVIQPSPSAVHENVNIGNCPIGVTSEKAATRYDTSESGFLKIVYPSDGTSAVPEGVAVVNGCPSRELAELFVEFVLSEPCQSALNIDFDRRPIRGDVASRGLPTLSEFPVTTYNFDYASANRQAIVERWQDILNRA